jgi:hypothetical protein
MSWALIADKVDESSELFCQLRVCMDMATHRVEVELMLAEPPVGDAGIALVSI